MHLLFINDVGDHEYWCKATSLKDSGREIMGMGNSARAVDDKVMQKTMLEQQRLRPTIRDGTP